MLLTSLIQYFPLMEIKISGKHSNTSSECNTAKKQRTDEMMKANDNKQSLFKYFKRA